MSKQNKTYWKLSYDQGVSKGMIKINSFDTLPEAIKALRTCNHKTSLIEEWEAASDVGNDSYYDHRLSQSITKSELLEIFG